MYDLILAGRCYLLDIISAHVSDIALYSGVIFLQVCKKCGEIPTVHERVRESDKTLLTTGTINLKYLHTGPGLLPLRRDGVYFFCLLKVLVVRESVAKGV